MTEKRNSIILRISEFKIDLGMKLVRAKEKRRENNFFSHNTPPVLFLSDQTHRVYCLLPWAHTQRLIAYPQRMPRRRRQQGAVFLSIDMLHKNLPHILCILPNQQIPVIHR